MEEDVGDILAMTLFVQLKFCSLTAGTTLHFELLTEPSHGSPKMIVLFKYRIAHDQTGQINRGQVLSMFLSLLIKPCLVGLGTHQM